jgi:hypothetical protein
MPKQSTQQNRNGKPEERPDEGVPQPPPFERKLQIAPLQRIGIPLLALLPLLALFGVFGEGMTSKQASNEEVAIQVDYVSRYRYRMQDTMTVAVTNLSKQPEATLIVTFDRDYLEHFSDISFVPDIKQVTDVAYEVELAGMKSGETRLVNVEMKGEHYWTQDGTVSASLSGGQPVSVAVSTTIFP